MARKPRFTWDSDAGVAVFFSRFNLGGIFEVLRDEQPTVNQSDSRGLRKYYVVTSAGM